MTTNLLAVFGIQMRDALEVLVKKLEPIDPRDYLRDATAINARATCKNTWDSIEDSALSQLSDNDMDLLYEYQWKLMCDPRLESQVVGEARIDNNGFLHIERWED